MNSSKLSFSRSFIHYGSCELLTSYRRKQQRCAFKYAFKIPIYQTQISPHNLPLKSIRECNPRICYACKIITQRTFRGGLSVHTYHTYYINIYLVHFQLIFFDELYHENTYKFIQPRRVHG